MSAIADFKAKFDTEGCLRDRDGSLAVVFTTRGGARFPGRLHFSNGLCVRAEIQGGGEWSQPDGSPIHGTQFLLNFGGEALQVVAIDQGHLTNLDEPKLTSSKRDFLLNLRVARNLFVHPPIVKVDSPTVDAEALSADINRAAIWLTPRSVAGFDAADFRELGPTRQAELLAAVQSFQAVADLVPPNQPATHEQFSVARAAFAKILDILAPYLPVADEDRQVEAALRVVRFPSWVVNWDYELGSDSDGIAAAWVNVFADEQAVPWGQLGREATELTSKVRQAFDDKRIARWPYIRMKTALEHKVW